MPTRFKYETIRKGLVGYWRPSRYGNGNGLLLDSISGNHGTLTNGPTWTPSAGGGSGGYALNLDGSNDSVVMANGLPDLPQWSVSAWIRVSSLMGGSFSAVFAGKFGAVNGNGIGFHGPAGHAFLLRNNAVPANRRIDVALNTWTNVIATWDGATSALYANTIAATAGAADSGFGILNTRIGQGFSSNFFMGLVDDVAVFSRALTMNEISTLYTAGRGALDQRVNVTVVRGATTSTGTGSASITEANDTVSSTATIAIAATTSITELSDTVSSASTIAIRATAGITEASDTLSSASAVSIAATLSATEASDTCVGSSTIGGGAGIVGQSTVTEASDTLSSTAAIAIAATAGITEASDSVVLASTLLLRAVAAITEAGDTLSASSTSGGAAVQLSTNPFAITDLTTTWAW